ncbi:hypothetical protein [Marinobacterium marinum]|uniref:Uncharacterized protein n=1 Tax=Marinobacterium marinum TaxID=2756129 RepID=A0A7W1WWE8_9GAMM|nr:hypothetical protein [Marinobacterium marinum]MBA4501261.1 hypothetical protein [Marinobacterium marinum]
MEFSKDQKNWVINWVERQFDKNALFPGGCSAASKKDAPCVCSAHIRAYKTWSNTPRKRRHIRGWIEEWLNAEEVERLQAELKKRQAKAARKSGS